MSRAAGSAVVSGSGRGARAFDVAARLVERWLRVLGHPRLAVGLLVLAAVVNVVAAADARLRGLLDSPAYLALIGSILLTGIAAVGVRVPLAWREWHHPAAIPEHGDVLASDFDLGGHSARSSGMRSSTPYGRTAIGWSNTTAVGAR